MIGAVTQVEAEADDTRGRAPLEAVLDPTPADNPAAFGGPVKATGRTPAGLLVRLVDYDHDRMVDDASEYDAWPADEPRDAPPWLLGRLLVELADSDGALAVAGVVSWHRVAYGPNPGAHAWNVGIGLAPASRGHGVGTVAQRLLAEWLLASTPTERIEASTDVANLAEQRALERAGFTREGTLRSAQRRADGRHDLVVYSRLRTDT
jgi:RimJ/RimL family protein N-acetyltransferase